MKTVRKIFSLIFLILFISLNLFGQDTSSTWMFDINSSKFKLYHKTKYIPKEFYNIISVEDKNDIVDNDKNFKRNCIGPGITRKLNWLAKDKYKRCIISISYGGRVFQTIFYCFDFDSGKLNANGFYIRVENHDKISFPQFISLINERKLEREDIDFDYNGEDQ